MLGAVSQVRQFNNSKPKTSQKIIKIKQKCACVLRATLQWEKYL